jgi:membrane protein
MIWLYILAIAVLIGAALNASFDELWPEVGPARARIELMRRLRQRARLPRLRRSSEAEEAPDHGVAEVDHHPDLGAEETVVLRREGRG